MKSNKKIMIIISILIFVFISGSIVTIILADNTEMKKVENEKIDSEILYLENTLLSIFSCVTDDNSPNWYFIKNKFLNLYSSWNSIILDLNNIQIKNTNLINFGKGLDSSMISISSTNKATLISNIGDLYYLLMLYTDGYNCNYDLKTNIAGKYYLIRTYSLLDSNNWTLVNENIVKVEKIYYDYINNINYSNKSDLQINKIYISIKELENTIVMQSKELFYMKFKIVMDNF